jgi:hypothetical protein
MIATAEPAWPATATKPGIDEPSTSRRSARSHRPRDPHAGQSWFGDLDLAFSPSGFTAGFDALRPAATTMTIDGLSALVAALDDVIASKEAAGRDKDFEALPRLLRLRQGQEQNPTGPDEPR